MLSYQESAKRLKKLGLLPKNDKWDLRKSLSNGQKSYITKLEGEFKQLLAHPENYSKITVSDARAEGISGEAFKVKGKGRKKTQVFYIGEVKKVGRKSVTVKQKDYIHEIFDTTGKNILEKIADAEKKLKEDQMLMVSIGGRLWNTKFTNSYSLEKYVKDWKPKDDNSDPDELMAQMVITTTDLPEGLKRVKKKTKVRSNRRRN